MQADSQVLIDRNYPAMQLSLYYCEPAKREKILALYGLLATVEECLYRASDPLVSRAKLGWWLEELHKADSKEGSHPLTCQLQNSGALNAWSDSLLPRLFASALIRIDDDTGLNNENSLRGLCESTGMIQLELESALQDLPIPDDSLVQQWAAINGLMQLFRESFKAKKPTYYWVPLTLCAQLGIERQKVADYPSVELSCQLFATIIEIALNWLESVEGKALILQKLPKQWASKNQHWIIFSSLQQRQLARLKRELLRPGTVVEHVDALQRMSFSDGWAAWRLARQLDRFDRG